MRTALLLACLFALALSPAGVVAQELPEEEDDLSLDLDIGDVEDVEVADMAEVEPVELLPVLCRGLTVPLHEMGKAGSLQLTIDHRAMQSLDENPGHDFLGLDAGGLKIGFALRYAPLDFVDVLAARQNNTVEAFDTYDLAARVSPLTQEKHFVDGVLGGGASLFVHPEHEDAVGWNGQRLVGRSLPAGFDFTVGLLAATESSGPAKSNADYNYSAAAAGELSWGIGTHPHVRIHVEAVAPVIGYNAGHPALAAGVNILTYRHGFAFLVANSQMLTLDALPSGSHQELDELVVGFSILRQWDL